MVCKIKNIRSYLITPVIRNKILRDNPLAPLVTDVCQFGKRKYSKSELLEILKGDFRKLTKEFLDSLSEADYKFCVDYAKSGERFWDNPISNEDIRDISRYCDIMMRGLRAIAPNQKVKLISIGQSPAVLTQCLAMRGVDTAILPISGLSHETSKSIKLVAQSKFTDEYFKYLKDNFGIDFNNLDDKTKYMFIDYSYTGRSLRYFKELLMAKNIRGNKNICFIPLQRFAYRADLSPQEKFFVIHFHKTKLSIMYLKHMYSQIFRMPVSHFKEIAQRHANSPCARTIRGNKLQVLLHDYQKHPQNYPVSPRTITMRERCEEAKNKIFRAFEVSEKEGEKHIPSMFDL